VLHARLGGRWRTAALVGLATVALLVFARVVGRFYWHDIIFALNGWYVPYDLAVFLDAGDDVLAGRSPYADVATFAGSDNYVYPPALALVLAPLAAIPAAQAATIFTLLGIAAIIVGLLLFGVRDRRCILLALFFPGTHESLKYGALGSFLVLLLGLLWRYRDRAALAGSSAAAAVVLKLFLAPFVVWLWLTRRVRAAALGVALGAALALVSWAAIGFAGLVDYPTMLRKFSDLEAEASYSLVGIGSAFGLSGTAARVLALACGAVLLLFAARAARSSTFEPLERDRRSFTLVLAASLALSPVVWQHYLALLVVPIALARPRFSPLWLLPLAVWPLFLFDVYDDWPEGDLAPLLSTLVLVVAVFVGCLRRPSTRLLPHKARAEPA